MTTFSDKQIAELDAPLSREVVKLREGKFSYIESWHAIAEANRIFGFGGWTSETIETHCVAQGERRVGDKQGWGVSYTAKARVTAGGVHHDGCGAGHGIGADLGLAHEKALKEAESDARKRALMQFGNQFGLALYDKEQANVADAAEEPDARQRWINECYAKIDEFDPATDDPKLWFAWWNSQHKARDDFLDLVERIEMKNYFTTKLKLPQREP
jgi:DNA recombination protein Rad52